MSIEEPVTTFGGLPVREYEPGEAEDGDFAWRVSVDYDEDFGAFNDKWLALMDEPWVGRIKAVLIGYWAEDEGVPCVILAMHADQLTSLRAVYLGELTDEEADIGGIYQNGLDVLLDAYPDLTTLRVRGQFPHRRRSMAPVSHPGLTELAFESGGLSTTAVEALFAGYLPNLRRLELWLGTRTYSEVAVDDLGPLMAGRRFPKLDRLGLCHADIVDEVAAALAGAPVIAGLASLDLSLGNLSDDGATALLAGQPLTHLTKLDLHHHFLSQSMMDRLRRELPGVDLDLSQPRVAISGH